MRENLRGVGDEDMFFFRVSARNRPSDVGTDLSDRRKNRAENYFIE